MPRKIGHPDCGAPHRVDRRFTIKALALGGVALLVGGIATPAGAADQAGWRWCRKCQGMFYALDASGRLGLCPAGGPHDPAASAHYFVRMAANIDGVQQGGWSWCPECMGLYYSGGRGFLGVCPAGGTHTNPSGGYVAILGDDGPRQQGGWRWCSKCMGMFYGQSDGGVCPSDRRAHDGSTSIRYAALR